MIREKVLEYNTSRVTINNENYEILKNDKLPNLTCLINNLTKNIREKTTKNIKNPEKLLESLHKLYDIIGMTKLKESIAKQTSFLINKLETGNLNMKMLNTILSGPPGVGKTTIGIILSEIWYHLGFLQLANTKNDNFSDHILKTLSSYDKELLHFYIALISFVIINIYYKIIKPLYDAYGIYILIISLVCIISLLFIGFLYIKQQQKQINDTNAIVITSRTNFVDIYVGGTANKTEKFLKENLGKVIFIDEAYSLYHGYQDSYGMEALTCINKFMSEHENEIVIIFAGYENLMKNGIFHVQPGLNRRCMWNFTCDMYNGKDLYKIFMSQLKKENLEIIYKDKYKIKDYIIKYSDIFTGQGGDCSKLVFYTQLNKNTRDINTNYVTYEDIKYGINELKLYNAKASNTNTTSFTDKLSELIH